MKKSKFNVSNDKSKRTYDDKIFDSVAEMRFYRDYILPRVESGEIIKHDPQVKYELQEQFVHNCKKILPINYVADFVITWKDNRQTVVDVKGMPSPIALLKRKLFWYKYPDIDYRWMCYSLIDSNGENGGFVDYEVVKQGRKNRKTKKNKGE